MASFSFITAQEIRFGRGVAKEAVSAVSKRGNCVFVVHGATAERARWLLDLLGQENIQTHRFSCAAEPDVEMIMRGSAAARACRADVVVAVGGGAAIDTGKAIAALVPSDRALLDHLEVVGKGLPLVHDPLPFIAIPTTAGTGAEVTKNAVITVPEHHRKVSLRDARMLPDLALVDPALTDNSPQSVTLASGLDAVTQVIEPYISAKSNRMSDALCQGAIRQGLHALTGLMRAENSQNRDDMAWVSLCGGLALANSGLGAVHGLAGVIGGICGAPHGEICGSLLPHVLQANTQHAGKRGKTAIRLAEIQGWIADALEVEPVEAFPALAGWARDQGLRGLGDMGLVRDAMETVARDSLSSSSMKGNPVPLNVGDLTEILKSAF